ncbi:membrane protein [Actinoallomurus vinaceus]|uniref:Membrane protein n=1 Tax=Actinoallomurus vinaceus TaxID=1080074 RepID=A0ABP8U9F5_9ACTN
MKTSLRAVLVGVVAVAVQALMVTAFAWPAAHIAPRHVSIVVAGPASAGASVAQRLDAEHPGAFEVKRRPDEAAARRALADREAYGAIVVTQSGPRVLVASAASPTVAQLLTQMSQQLSGVRVPAPQDVVPADPDDPRGAAFGALVLPLVISSIACGVLLTLLVGSAEWRGIGVVVFAAGAGLLTATILAVGLSVVPGSYVAVAGVVGLTSLAVASTLAGLAALLGRAGIVLGVAIMMLLANPLSGVTSAPELLPRPWGTIGQNMPAGAGGTLLRSAAFFDGARAGGPLTVLLVWSAAGLLLIGAGALRNRRVRSGNAPERHTPAPVPAGS